MSFVNDKGLSQLRIFYYFYILRAKQVFSTHCNIFLTSCNLFTTLGTPICYSHLFASFSLFHLIQLYTSILYTLHGPEKGKLRLYNEHGPTTRCTMIHTNCNVVAITCNLFTTGCTFIHLLNVTLFLSSFPHSARRFTWIHTLRSLDTTIPL